MKMRTFILLLALLATTASSQETREVKKTFDMNKDGEVSVDTYKGTITVTTWEKAQVSVEARIEPDGWSRHNERKVRDTEIRFSDSPDGVRIVTDYDRLKSRSWDFLGLFGGSADNLPFVHYTITMPAGARLRIKDYKSDSRIDGLRSAIRLETYKGKVEIANADGPLDLETYKGDVRIDFRDFSADTRMETYKGKIDLTLPRDSHFKLDADIGRRGDLNSDFDLSVRRKHRGDETYQSAVNGGGPLLSISTEKGDVRLRQK